MGSLGSEHASTKLFDFRSWQALELALFSAFSFAGPLDVSWLHFLVGPAGREC